MRMIDSPEEMMRQQQILMKALTTADNILREECADQEELLELTFTLGKIFVEKGCMHLHVALLSFNLKGQKVPESPEFRPPDL